MLNRSQQQVIECISEIDSENEFSYIKNGCEDEEEEEEIKNGGDLPIKS